MEWSLKTWLAPWAYIASVIYHDSFWYPLKGKAGVLRVMRSGWGRLFHNWDKARTTEAGYADLGDVATAPVRNVLHLVWMSVKILWTCVREAPELAARKRSKKVQAS